MLSKYQSFITKKGNIIFPIFFITLYLLFIIQPFYFVASTEAQTETAVFYFKNTLGYFYTSITSYMGIFPILAIVVCIIFFVVYIKSKKIIKPLLFIVPLCYLLQVSIVCILAISDKAITYIPFVAFYLVLLLFILAVLYCLRPIKKTQITHKPTKAERIAELEKQVADLQSKLPSEND